MSIPKSRIAEIISTHSPDLAPERVASLAETLAGMKEFSAPPEITLEALPPQEVPGMRALLLRKGGRTAERDQAQSKEDPFRSAELRFISDPGDSAEERARWEAQWQHLPHPFPELDERLARLDRAPLNPELKKAALEAMRKLRETMPPAPLAMHTYYGRDRRPGPDGPTPVPAPPAEIFYLPGDPPTSPPAAPIDYMTLPGERLVGLARYAADWQRIKELRRELAKDLRPPGSGPVIPTSPPPDPPAEIRAADIRPPGAPLAGESVPTPLQMQEFHEGLARDIDQAAPGPRLAWHPMKIRATDFHGDSKVSALDFSNMRFKDPGPFIVEKVQARCIHCGAPAGGALIMAQRVAPESRCLACPKAEESPMVAVSKPPPPRHAFLDADSQEFGPQCALCSAPCSGAHAARQGQVPGLKCPACPSAPLGAEPTRHCQRCGQPGATAAEREAQRTNEDAPCSRCRARLRRETPPAVPALPALCQLCGAPCSAGVRALQLQDPAEPCAACAGRAS